uniref:Nebulin n=1 Tax=Eptatretus burgeri TaxID=7764 RepID=A0A8C4N5G7_EPTBU
MPDMLEIVAAKKTQRLISDLEYKTIPHTWSSQPNVSELFRHHQLQEQNSDHVYKDDLNWMKGLGCYIWDRPDFLLAKHRHNISSDVLYRAKGDMIKNKYTTVLDTPDYQHFQAVREFGDVKYRHSYLHEVRGMPCSVVGRMDIKHAEKVAHLQCDREYREDGKKVMASGGTLLPDSLSLYHSKCVRALTSERKYREGYENTKANAYKLPVDSVSVLMAKNANKLQSQNLYQKDFQSSRGQVHLPENMLEVVHAKSAREAISEVQYRLPYRRIKGQMISQPVTREMVQSQELSDIVSDSRYKEDLMWMHNVGCTVPDTPALDLARSFKVFMVRSSLSVLLHCRYTRFARNVKDESMTCFSVCSLQAGYTKDAKAVRHTYTPVLDTPEYLRLQELKKHFSDLYYRAHGNIVKTRYTPVLETPVIIQAKKAQQQQSKYLYSDLAIKDMNQFTLVPDAPVFIRAKMSSDLINKRKYVENYEMQKMKYITVPDTPFLLRAMKANHLASDVS